MPELIIGHTTEETARIWVRGDERNKRCRLELKKPKQENSLGTYEIHLTAASDYTGTIDIVNLEPGVEYILDGAFDPSRSVAVHGKLCTIRPSAQAPHSFSFVLSSCNLSTVSVNNFLAFLGASLGMSLAKSALSLPFDRWRLPHLHWVWRAIKWPLGGTFQFAGNIIMWLTGIKQSGGLYLRSPFVKLSAVFDAWRLEVGAQPDQRLPNIGDRVQTTRGAVGVVAAIGTDRNGLLSELVLTQVEGEISRQNDVLRRCDDPDKVLCTIKSAEQARPWFTPPSFFLHVGDQIYYDFPNPQRAPAHAEYRIAYREAWFEDPALRYLLAHWPHYMTLDDHEIVDQFALDFNPPKTKHPEKHLPEVYLSESTKAYTEYVHAHSPPRLDGSPAPASGPFWYTFSKGVTQFFVMDTRTRRRGNKMLDDHQKKCLMEWLTTHRNALKFVITSVPFVAEIKDPQPPEKHTWYRGPSSGSPNSENDKWCAERFRGQRDEIIEHVAMNDIRHVVFLTGDMHCCYHATLRIGTPGGQQALAEPTKYGSLVVHELAGGPVNQLQLARIEEFVRRATWNTKQRGIQCAMQLERFHSDVSAVMHLEVDYVERDEPGGADRTLVPEVYWNVIRTLTDPTSTAWRAEASDPSDNRPRGESVMGGRICFEQPRTSQDLPRWPE